MRLSWKEKDKRLIDGIERLRQVAREYGLQMPNIEQHNYNWNDPIEKENEVKMIKEYVIILKEMAPFTIKVDSFEFCMDDMFVFYDADGDEIAMFVKEEVVGVSLVAERAESRFGCATPTPLISGPVA